VLRDTACYVNINSSLLLFGVSDLTIEIYFFDNFMGDMFFIYIYIIVAPS